MRHKNVLVLSLPILLAACGGSDSSNHDDTIRLSSFNLLPAEEPRTVVSGISGNGVVTFGFVTNTNDPIYWTNLSGPQTIAPPAGYNLDDITGLTDDGSTFVGSVSGPSFVGGYRYSATDGFSQLPLPSGFDNANVTDVNSDGTVLLGIAGKLNGEARAFVYQNGVSSLLPEILSNGQSTALAVSAKGTYAVGSSNRLPVRWKTGGTPEILALSTLPGSASDVSDDGTVVVGWTLDGDKAMGFRWTSSNGMIPFGFEISASDNGPLGRFGPALSGNGRTVVGNRRDAQGLPHPFLWTERGGFQDLETLLQWPEQPFGGLMNPMVKGISRDGKTLVGSGQDPDFSGSSRAWKIVLK